MSYYYRKIEIDHLDIIQTKCLEYIKTQKEIYLQKPVGSFRFLNFQELTACCPELLTAFNRYGLTCTYAIAFIMYSNSDVVPHIDDKDIIQARINIPLENYKNTFTMFFEGGAPTLYINHNTGISTTLYKGPGLRVVDKVEIDQATVIRIKAPHSVQMDDTHAPRVILTLGFNLDPVFLLDEL